MEHLAGKLDGIGWDRLRQRGDEFIPEVFVVVILYFTQFFFPARNTNLKVPDQIYSI